LTGGVRGFEVERDYATTHELVIHGAEESTSSVSQRGKCPIESNLQIGGGY